MRLVLGCLLLGVVAAACGVSEKDRDQAYVEGWCLATNEFSDALVAANDAPAIVAAINTYHDDLAALEPEDDLADFHSAFLAYLVDIAADPAGLSSARPPGPPSDARLRIEALASTADACEGTDLFGRP